MDITEIQKDKKVISRFKGCKQVYCSRLITRHGDSTINNLALQGN